MTMITTCPACRTRFRVTPEQLKAHGGDVRCGRCAKVFLAHNYLEYEPEAMAPEKVPAVQAESVAEDVPQPAEEMLLEFDAAEEFHPPSEEASEEPPVAPQTEEEPQSAEEMSQSEAAEEFLPPYEEAPKAPEQETSTPTEDAGEELQPAEEMPLQPEAAEAFPSPPEETSEAPPPAAHEPVQDVPLDLIYPDWESPEKTPVEGPTEEKGVAKKRRFFWLWLLCSILLLVGLGGQGLYFFRSDLAARHPDLKPLLQRFCDVLQCSIRLPADPDLLSIEASSLEADPAQANLITLNAILRNRAKLAQEYPQLELTLTDTKDQMVARRIFSPRDYAKNADLGRGMPPNEELTVKLYLDLGDLKAAGYRVFLFYPR